MALSRVVSEVFNVEKYLGLEMPIKGQSRSSKVAPYSIDWLWFPISNLPGNLPGVVTPGSECRHPEMM